MKSTSCAKPAILHKTNWCHSWVRREYILEVGRREFGGRYLWHDERNQPILVVGEPTRRIALLAQDKVRGRLGGDAGDNIPFFYAGFVDRARSAQPGTDVLYV